MPFNAILLILTFFIVAPEPCEALPSPDKTSQAVIQDADDPSKIADDVDNTILYSFKNTHPDLYQLGVIPVNDISTTRLFVKGNDVLPYLTTLFHSDGSEDFSITGNSDLSHEDDLKVE